MASNAFQNHLFTLLQDFGHLLEVAGQLSRDSPNRSLRIGALNRAVIVTAVSAWEAYIEELVREAVALLRPSTQPMGLWTVHNAVILGQLGRFNNPNFENVRSLLSDAIGLQDIQKFWVWQNCTSSQARLRLAEVMKLRHEIAHGVHPRPNISPHYTRQVPDYFRRLGRSTDRVVRSHLVNILGIAEPWPA